MKKILILLCLLFIITGCNNKNDDKTPPPDGAVFCKNFISTYVIPEKITLSVDMPEYIYFTFSGESIEADYIPHQEKYQYLAERYNDLSYNRKDVPGTRPALSEPFDQVTIACDKEFAGTEAGQPLKKVIRFCGVSAAKYIAKGYVETDPELTGEMKERFEYFPGRYYPVYEWLDDITAEQTSLLYVSGRLYFDITPDPGIYKFKVTVKIGGKELSDTFERTFN